MGDKKTDLSIVIRTVDQATAGIKAVNARLDAMTRPTRELGKAISDLHEKSGLAGLVDGFKGVGSAIGDLLGKVAMIGGVAGLAVGGLVHLVNDFDDLGKKAARLGVGVDFLAGMRDAAEHTGVPIEALDDAMGTFAVNIGKAKVGAGKLAAFLPKITTNKDQEYGTKLLARLKAAKDETQQIQVISEAMARLKDPGNQATLAQMAFGDKAIAPLISKGPKAIRELTANYLKHAGSLEEATKKAEETKGAMLDLKASTEHVEASIVSGLSPALTVLIGQLTDWLDGHQGEIAAWAKDIGEKLPGAIQALVKWIKEAADDVVDFVDSVGGLKTVALAAAAVVAGPLVSAVGSLSTAILTSPIGPFVAAAGGLYALSKLINNPYKGHSTEGDFAAAAKRAQNPFDDPTRGDVFDAFTTAARGHAFQGRGAIGTFLQAAQGDADLTGTGHLPDQQKAFDAIMSSVRPNVAPQASAAMGSVDELSRAAQAMAAAAGALTAKGGSQGPSGQLTIKIDGAPRGTKVTADAKAHEMLDSVHTGYNLGTP